MKRRGLGQVGGVLEPRRGVEGQLGDGFLEAGPMKSRLVFRRRGPGTCIRWTAARLQVQAASSAPEEGFLELTDNCCSIGSSGRSDAALIV